MISGGFGVRFTADWTVWALVLWAQVAIQAGKVFLEMDTGLLLPLDQGGMESAHGACTAQ